MKMKFIFLLKNISLYWPTYNVHAILEESCKCIGGNKIKNNFWPNEKMLSI